MELPLGGIRVLDVSVMQQGPLCGALLGDMGADVIKVEGLPKGDPIRGVIEQRVRPLPSSAKINWHLELFNRNKRSIAVNMGCPQGIALLHRLAQGCDTFLTNLRLPALEARKLDYPSLNAVNPRIIYALATGFGTKGPDRDRPALDLAVQARSGLMTLMGEPDSPPVAAPIGFADKVGALFLAYAIVLALLHREKTGVGQQVDASLLGGLLYIAATDLQYSLDTGETPSRVSRKNLPNALRNIYQAGDGRWLAFNMIQSDRYWNDFCQALGIPEIEADPRFQTLQSRAAHSKELIAILDRVFTTKPREEWSQSLSRYDLIWGAVNTFAEVASDAQVLENEYIANFDHPAYGTVREVGIPVKLSRTPGQIRRPAPQFGQHTEEVLLEAGYTWEEIAQLKEEGAIP